MDVHDIRTDDETVQALVQALASAVAAGSPPLRGPALPRVARTTGEPARVSRLLTRTCTRCGASYTGEQTYYEGYEGDFLKKTMRSCPQCFVRDLRGYFRDVWNFELLED